MSESKLKEPKIPTLDDLPKVVSTKEAAAILNRTPQTLRKWACMENGPIRPIRIHRRLAWRVEDLRALLESGVTDPRQMSLFPTSNVVDDEGKG